MISIQDINIAVKSSIVSHLILLSLIVPIILHSAIILLEAPILLRQQLTLLNIMFPAILTIPSFEVIRRFAFLLLLFLLVFLFDKYIPQISPLVLPFLPPQPPPLKQLLILHLLPLLRTPNQMLAWHPRFLATAAAPINNIPFFSAVRQSKHQIIALLGCLQYLEVRLPELNHGFEEPSERYFRD